MKGLPFLVILLLSLSACRTIRQTETEYVYVHNTDTLTQYSYQRDSIYIHDFIERWTQGDTVYIKERHTEYRDRENRDTVHWVKTVTITNRLYYTKEKEVNRLCWWQKALIWTGGAGIISGLGFLVWRIRK